MHVQREGSETGARAPRPGRTRAPAGAAACSSAAAGRAAVASPAGAERRRHLRPRLLAEGDRTERPRPRRLFGSIGRIATLSSAQPRPCSMNATSYRWLSEDLPVGDQGQPLLDIAFYVTLFFEDGHLPERRLAAYQI